MKKSGRRAGKYGEILQHSPLPAATAVRLTRSEEFSKLRWRSRTLCRWKHDPWFIRPSIALPSYLNSRGMDNVHMKVPRQAKTRPVFKPFFSFLNAFRPFRIIHAFSYNLWYRDILNLLLRFACTQCTKSNLGLGSVIVCGGWESRESMSIVMQSRSQIYQPFFSATSSASFPLSLTSPLLGHLKSYC
jgi:hypothetical protein